MTKPSLLLSKRAQSIKPGIYHHFRGGDYRVLGVGFEEATLAEVVIYQSLETGHWFTRPLASFVEPVESAHGMLARFRFIREEVS